MDKEQLFVTDLGDTVFRYNDAVVIQLNGKRNVASTSTLNGGVRSDLAFVFNKSCGNSPRVKIKPGQKCTYEAYYQQIVDELGLDGKTCTGMGTSALVENMAVVTEAYEQLSVTAMVTAGVDANGGRAGDPAPYDECTNQTLSPGHGTVNIFLLINARVPDGTLNRAIVTATEANCVALQELMANSVYSHGLATGSGTDTIIIIGNLESPVYLENAGKHSKLGELIGRSVIKAVKEALDKQTGMNASRQASVTWQNKRYGITPAKIWESYEHIYGNGARSREQFEESLREIDRDKKAVAHVASCVHLVDQYSWGLLDQKTVHDVCRAHLNAFRSDFGLPGLAGQIFDKHHVVSTSSFQKKMIDPLVETMALLCHK